VIALLLAGLLATASAQETAPEVDEEAAVVEVVADPAPILACLTQANRDPAAERACVGLQAEDCIDGLGAAAEASALAACSAGEAAAWDRIVGAMTDEIIGLLRLQTAAEGGAGAGPQETLLVEAQTAWGVFREADCAQAAAHWGEDPMRDATLAECRLDRTATRALELLSKRRQVEAP
jgi:uncharacterized protein YecT (DUF1311 family)